MMALVNSGRDPATNAHEQVAQLSAGTLQHTSDAHPNSRINHLSYLKLSLFYCFYDQRQQ